MSKPVVVITYPFFPEILKKELHPHARVILARTPSSLKRALESADGLISLLSVQVDRKLLSHAPGLKVVSNFAVGYDNIDLQACAERGIRVTNTPDVLTRATAELTLGLLLAAARRFPEGHSLCQKNRFLGWTPDLLLGVELQGRSAVIVGPGRIGHETARLFRAIGIKVRFISRQDSERAILKKLKTAQILSLHLPLNSSTRHWLDLKKLEALPGDAIVLNTTRGPTVDENALAQVLKKRRILAAGLDVYEKEPQIPRLLRALPNVVLLPHLGSATQEARQRMARLAIQGVLGILGGKAIPNEVNFRRKL